MGRFYNGDINGKFWYGIQASNDALHFGANEFCMSIFHVCDCATANATEDSFCKSCFNSLDEHMFAVAQEGIEDDKTWFDARTNRYELEDCDQVETCLQELEDEVGHYISSYSTDERFDYDLSKEDWKSIDTLPKWEQQLIARLCFGRQILACIKSIGSCSFLADCDN
jgi:hypothetical protein